MFKTTNIKLLNLIKNHKNQQNNDKQKILRLIILKYTI